jgi:TonB family protein
VNSTFHGILFDGETLAGLPVVLGVAAGRLQSAEAAPVVDASLADVAVSDRLADVPRFLYLPDNRTIETSDNAAIDALLEAQRRGRLVRIVHALEAHSRAAAAATVILVAATVATIAWGLPVLARRAALAVPESIEQQAGQAGLASLRPALAPSTLTTDQRSRVQAQLDRLMQAGGYPGSPKLEFWSMGGTYPNAFALPGGYIVVSDELVELASEDEEIAAVLAHEIGHWQHRHGLQALLRSSTALLVVSTLTGDLSTLTTFAGTLPFLILQHGHSREFETEADDFAAALLDRARIDREYFATILEKLEKSRPSEGLDFTYLSTHPSTADRITRLQPGGRRPKLPAPPPVADAPSKPSAAVELRPTDIRPRGLYRPAPIYPATMIATRQSGSVVVQFTINNEGNVVFPEVVRSSDREFEAPALESVAAWKYSPALRDGKPIAIRVSQLLEFNYDTGPVAPE